MMDISRHKAFCGLGVAFTFIHMIFSWGSLGATGWVECRRWRVVLKYSV